MDPILTTSAKQNAVTGSREKSSRTWIPVLLLTVAAAIFLWFYDGRMVSGLIRADAMDYAQLGRNLINGHGLSTYILRPLALTHGSNPTLQPDVTHGPLYPFLISLAFGLFGAKDGAVQAVSGLCFVLTVPLLVLLGHRLFNRTIGLFGAAVLAFNPAMLQYASEGSIVPLLLLLTTCLFLALDRIAANARAVGAGSAVKPTRSQAAGAERTNKPAKVQSGNASASKSANAALILAGICSGLLYLAEPLLIWMLPILVVFVILWHPRRRSPAALWMLLPMSLLVLPWMVRFGMLTGSPVFGLRSAELWMGTRAYPGFLGYRMTTGDIETGFGLFKSIVLKIFLAANTGLGALQHMPANGLLLFAVPGLFFRYGDRGVNKIRSVALACLIGIFVGNLFFTFDATLLTVAFPVLLLCALAYLLHLMHAAKLTPVAVSLVSIGIGVVLLVPLIAALLTTRIPVTAPEAQVALALQRQSRPDEVSLSDQPWLAAWYANRPSLWIPSNAIGITTMRKQFPTTRWLFLTPEVRGLSREWSVAFNGLMNWDQEYQQAQQTGKTAPAVVRITGQQLPLMAALDGFESVPPVGTDAPTAVLAAVPNPEVQGSARAGEVGPGGVLAK